MTGCQIVLLKDAEDAEMTAVAECASNFGGGGGRKTRGKTPLILELDNRWRRVISFALRPLCPRVLIRESRRMLWREEIPVQSAGITVLNELAQEQGLLLITVQV
jgi:hypothetical protein